MLRSGRLGRKGDAEEMHISMNISLGRPVRSFHDEGCFFASLSSA